MAELVLIRHGETSWSASGQHTSYTDLDLTPEGERQARALGDALRGRAFAAVLSSPRRRAARTAELAGIPVTTVDPDLSEWDYGSYEGITTAEIRKERPDWSLWTDGAPGGESPAAVGVRLDRVLDRLRSLLADDGSPSADGSRSADGDVAVFGHGHALRVLTARWLALPVSGGALFTLDSGTVSTLGFEHGQPVIVHWNVRP